MQNPDLLSRGSANVGEISRGSARRSYETPLSLSLSETTSSNSGTRMIVYRKSWLGLGLMLRWIGSALPRALIPALCSMALCTLLESTVPSPILSSFFEHPYAH